MNKDPQNMEKVTPNSQKISFSKKKMAPENSGGHLLIWGEV